MQTQILHAYTLSYRRIQRQKNSEETRPGVNCAGVCSPQAKTV